MRYHLVDFEHVGVFVMQIEEIYFMRQRAAVEAAFFYQHDVETVRISIDRGGAHATGCTLAADDHGPYAKLRQMRDKGRSEEGAGALFGDHHVAGLGFELRPDGVERWVARHRAAFGSGHSGWQAVGASIH